MKHSFKRHMAILFVLCFTIISTCPITAKAQNATYYNAAQICNVVYQGYNNGSRGPIIITKGTYCSGNTSKTIYLVTLSGTELVTNQSTGYYTDLLAGFNLNNAYQRNTINVINATVPKNSNLILAGHSLGGMIAQQVAADNSIKSNYNVMNTVCFGSPLLAAGSREGTVRRLGDTSDPVPYLSGSIFNNTAWAIAGLQKENGGYNGNVLNAHTQSYTRQDVWGKYDAVGTKNGNVSITLDLSTQKYFYSPRTVK